MRFGGNLKAMVFRVCGKVLIAARFSQSSLGFFVKHIAQTFEKQQWKDELLVIARVNRAAQQSRRTPKVVFELLLIDAGIQASKPSRLRMAISLSSAAKATAALSRKRFIASSTESVSCSVFGST